MLTSLFKLCLVLVIKLQESILRVMRREKSMLILEVT